MFLHHTHTHTHCTTPIYGSIPLQIYPCYFTPLPFPSLAKHNTVLESAHGSIPIIAIVAIFIALDFSRVENLCLFLLLLSNIQLPCNLIHTAEPDRAPLYHTAVNRPTRYTHTAHLNLWKCTFSCIRDGSRKAIERTDAQTRAPSLTVSRSLYIRVSSGWEIISRL